MVTDTLPFFEQVYTLVRSVPAGKVTTYGALAKALGTPDARRVGQARCMPTRMQAKLRVIVLYLRMVGWLPDTRLEVPTSNCAGCSLRECRLIPMVTLI